MKKIKIFIETLNEGKKINIYDDFNNHIGEIVIKGKVEGMSSFGNTIDFLEERPSAPRFCDEQGG